MNDATHIGLGRFLNRNQNCAFLKKLNWNRNRRFGRRLFVLFPQVYTLTQNDAKQMIITINSFYKTMGVKKIWTTAVWQIWQKYYSNCYTACHVIHLHITRLLVIAEWAVENTFQRLQYFAFWWWFSWLPSSAHIRNVWHVLHTSL